MSTWIWGLTFRLLEIIFLVVRHLLDVFSPISRQWQSYTEFKNNKIGFRPVSRLLYEKVSLGFCFYGCKKGCYSFSFKRLLIPSNMLYNIFKERISCSFFIVIGIWKKQIYWMTNKAKTIVYTGCCNIRILYSANYVIPSSNHQKLIEEKFLSK